MTGAAPPRPGITTAEIGLVGALTLVAAAIRLWQLGELPPGLHVDEAFNLLDARDVIAGARPLFLPANAGREALYTYLQAPAIALLGESATAARLPSALLGALAVPATWLAARMIELPGVRPRPTAVLAAGFMAFLYWGVHFSRFGIRAILFVPIVALTLAAWAWLVARAGAATPRETRVRAAALPVVAMALLIAAATAAHPAGRGLVLLPAAHGLFIGLRRRDWMPAAALAAASALAVVLLSPLLVLWWREPALFVGHAKEVSIMAEGPAALARNAGKVAAMFHLAGDPAPWRNLQAPPLGVPEALSTLGGRLTPGRPVYDPVSGLLAAAGLVWLLRAARGGSIGAWWVLTALVGLLAPSVLTDAAPNFSRAIGVLPLAALLPAVGVERALAMGRERVTRRAAVTAAAAPWRRATPLAGAAVLAVAAAWTCADYFSTWAQHPDTPMAFDADKVQLAAMARQGAGEGGRVFVSPFAGAHPTIRVGAGPHVRGFDPAGGLVAGPAGGTTTYLYLPDESETAAGLRRSMALAGHRLLPEIEFVEVDAVKTRLPPPGDAAPALLRVDLDAPDALLSGATLPAQAVFGGALRLVGARLPAAVSPASVFTVSLEWLAEAAAPGELNIFVHLRGSDGSAVAQHDGAPLAGTFPTSGWLAGDRVVSRHPLAAPDNVSEALDLVVGWYDWRTGDRLAVVVTPAAARPPEVVDEGTALLIGRLPPGPPRPGAGLGP